MLNQHLINHLIISLTLTLLQCYFNTIWSGTKYTLSSVDFTGYCIEKQTVLDAAGVLYQLKKEEAPKLLIYYITTCRYYFFKISAM